VIWEEAVKVRRRKKGKSVFIEPDLIERKKGRK
jgi:hypothetical protein